jgi:glycosyltransferase involved in cell wall biosynthesis
MKICYVCADLGIPVAGEKGASAHVRGLVRAFVSLGHEVVLVTPRGEGVDGLGARLVPVQIPELIAGVSQATDRRIARALGHLWNNVAVEGTLREVLRTFRPDIIYERYSPFGIAGSLVAKRFGVPHLLEVNAPLAWEGRRYRKQALQEAAESLERAAVATTSLVVAVSRELKELLVAAGHASSRIAVVPNGVDAELFRPDGDAYRDGLDDRLVVGFVGSLKPWHGLEMLADAFRRLARDSRFHLLVVGDGPQARVIEELDRELPGRVTRIGAVPHTEVPKYLRAMDIAVAPYPALERFYFSPLKVLEYMATGRAVVATGIGQLTELIRAGVNGVLVEPGRTGALGDAIAFLADDAGRRRALGRAAVENVRREHLWTHRARRVLEFVEAAA